MRLINAKTIRLEEFTDDKIPPYAILSHTWEQGEVSFQDMQEPQRAEASKKAGYIKIKYACEQALSEDFCYVWVDTCCIDKSSSSELSEAINSMFVWYQEAQICYVYLVDVTVGNESLHQSRWFTRGWTLQELIAPREISFYNANWRKLGTKQTLITTISSITGIEKSYLGGEPLSQASVAKRMSWASKRITTRKEDIAYSLLGIFCVNMPMLYGEGDKAFIRLQEEIIREIDDQSLFAWGINKDDNTPKNNRVEVLARSPADFTTVGNVIPCKGWNTTFPPSMTSKGLRIELPIHYATWGQLDPRPYGILLCHFEEDLFNLVALPLRAVAGTKDEFTRRGWKGPISVLEKDAKTLELKTIYINKRPGFIHSNQDHRYEGLLIRHSPSSSTEEGFSLAECFPTTNWDPVRHFFKTTSGSGMASLKALMHFKSDIHQGFVVVLEYDPKKIYSRRRSSPSHAQVHLLMKPEDTTLVQIFEGDDTYMSMESGHYCSTLSLDNSVSESPWPRSR